MWGVRLKFRFAQLALFCAAVALVLVVAGPSLLAAEKGPNPQALQRVIAVQERNSERLMATPGVVGTATGLSAQGQPVVKVFTVHPGVAGIPAKLESEPVVVEVTGMFFALGRPAGKKKPPKGGGPKPDPTSRWPSPVPIGVSVGNEFDYSAGTLGCTVTDGISFYALSNVHVFDPWHYGAVPGGVELGERIVQPGRIDDPADDGWGEATPDNILGKLVDSEPIDFGGGDNYIDAAMAIVPTEDYQGAGECRSLGYSTPPDGYGTPSSTIVEASVGLAAQKYGRTTRLTKGTVTAINATVDVGYDVGTARFVGQIIVESRKPFIKAGDSGSLLVTQSGKNPTGLLFAGNSTGKLAVANPIELVLGTFGVAIAGD